MVDDETLGALEHEMGVLVRRLRRMRAPLDDPLMDGFVMRLAERSKVRLSARFTRIAAASRGAGSSIVSGGCQTPTGERIPRQRESRTGPETEPGATPADTADGASAAAR